ncbi:hypothetical protein V8G54_025310 [Vigna mungo]|uniref:BZIP domain-containing protein n=1 Tax=Vigna mungo TaxID=3915 RepID=A0AAQ3RU01_VIGMU
MVLPFHDECVCIFKILQVGQSSLLASPNTLQRTSAENNMRFKNHSYKKISQPTSNVTPKAKENERRPSIQGINLKGSTKRYVCSAGEYLHYIFPTVSKFVHGVTSESKQRTAVVNDNKNDGGSTKVDIHLRNRQDIRSAKQQQSRMMPGTDNFEANPSDPNQNLHIDLSASSANPVLEEISVHWPVKHVSRTSELIINKNSTILLANVFTIIVHNAYKHGSFQLVDIFSAKHEKSSMTVRNGGAANNVTSIENCNSIQDKTNIGSNHFGANPTERNRNLSTKLSVTNPQLTKEESEEAKEQRRRQSNNKSAKRSRMKMKMERERLNASIKNLGVENAALRKELHDLLHEYDKIVENNDSMLDELNETFGKEKVMEVLSMQYADSGQC